MNGAVKRSKLYSNSDFISQQSYFKQSISLYCELLALTFSQQQCFTRRKKVKRFNFQYSLSVEHLDKSPQEAHLDSAC